MRSLVLLLLVLLNLYSTVAWAAPADEPIIEFNVNPKHVSTAANVKYDYDLIYVRVLRRADGKEVRWAEFGHPTNMEPGADLMLLHPDGTEELLVSGARGSVMDPYVGFDGEWVYYSKFTTPEHRGADIFKIHVPTRKIVRLTNQEFSPNTGVVDWSKSKLPAGVFNFGPCPAPGGKVVFTSSRNCQVPPRGYPPVALQLFVMDDDGANVEQIGYLNIAGALHPVILKDGRIIFSSLESHALHEGIHWGILSILPDGTYWAPVISALLREGGAQSGFHFQTQLSDENIIIERYYNQNQKGFGTLYKLPPRVPADVTPFGPGWLDDPRNKVTFHNPAIDKDSTEVMPFTPYGLQRMTPWIFWWDEPSYPIRPKDPSSPRIGKVTHPCGAPDNHLLVAWTMGPIGGSSGAVRDFMGPTPMDSGIYLIPYGQTTYAPGEMLLVKNDPKYNEQWPRPLVPYERVYGVREPVRHVHRNDGGASVHLPEGTPFGLVGTSSMYKRESAPQGRVPPGSVTAVSPVLPGDTIDSIHRFREVYGSSNWVGQGSDSSIYENDEIHAIRIVIQEPLTNIQGDRNPRFASHANERLRVLGEIPLRKFIADDQPTDPDGNPDTSFLAKIPADQSFTFQTLDKNGMLLNMAQTWHQVRPGEIRHDCGGCHAHSQQPTNFEETFAARNEYKIFDLTQRTPLITDKASDESGKKWDIENETGLRYIDGPLNVEYWRDIFPVLNRSCATCHSQTLDHPAGGLVLDDDLEPSKTERRQLAEGDEAPHLQIPATYARLTSYRSQESIYMRRFQSRRSYLIWKLYGRRLDGWTNDTFPSLVDPKDPLSGMLWRGKKVPEYEQPLKQSIESGNPVWAQLFASRMGDTDYAGSIMPPPEAVAGTYKSPEGNVIKVPPVSDEERRTFARWIDLGAPIELDPRYNPFDPNSKTFGWMGDDQRPTLTLTHPGPGSNPPLTRILVGMADAYSGIDLPTFAVTADFELEGIAAGRNLASQFKPASAGVWELKLGKTLQRPDGATLTVSIKDRQGNVSRIVRKFFTR